MIRSLVLFPSSADPAAVERGVQALVGVFKAASGVESIQISDGHLMSPFGAPPYSKIIEVLFKSLQDLMTFGGSSAIKDLQPELQPLGPTVLNYEIMDA